MPNIRAPSWQFFSEAVLAPIQLLVASDHSPTQGAGRTWCQTASYCQALPLLSRALHLHVDGLSISRINASGSFRAGQARRGRASAAGRGWACARRAAGGGSPSQGRATDPKLLQVQAACAGGHSPAYRRGRCLGAQLRPRPASPRAVLLPSVQGATPGAGCTLQAPALAQQCAWRAGGEQRAL